MSTYYAHAENQITSARVYCQSGSATDELRMLAAARKTVEDLTRAAVKSARQDGASWAEVGALLGVTKQAAQQRYTEPKLF